MADPRGSGSSGAAAPAPVALLPPGTRRRQPDSPGKAPVKYKTYSKGSDPLIAAKVRAAQRRGARHVLNRAARAPHHQITTASRPRAPHAGPCTAPAAQG